VSSVKSSAHVGQFVRLAAAKVVFVSGELFYQIRFTSLPQVASTQSLHALYARVVLALVGLPLLL